ncbi:polymorphic toxin-type HINT domain-containing protein [Streptomyces sp. NPDC007107]|uniref:polymorphic toxin-type HINT domain-containing protein n=1 Tax=Streptomyces sp. NPDC007107 TaxID=3156915 RepID=UPI0033C7E709
MGLDDGSELMDEALARTAAPSKLAAVLDKALTDVEKSPPAEGSGLSNSSERRASSVNGTPALGVDTSAGRLWVTKAAPHRVLRLEAYDVREDLSDLREQIEKGETPGARRRVTTGPLASGDGEGMDLFPILSDAAGTMYDTLVKYADQLKDATDHGITFTLDGAGEMNCGASGCTATQNFTGSVSSIARKERVTKGEVTAVMSADFSIDGRPAGRCTSAQRTFPVQGNNVSGTLKCSNPGAGSLYASVAARHKAQARAQADACGCTVRYSIPLRANTLIDARALAKVEAAGLAKQARTERDAAGCAKHSFPSGTQVLLADGTARAIEDVRIGDRVTAGDPRTPRDAERPVTNTFTDEDDRDFTRLTVTTDRGTATVTATDNHPFWLTDDQRWKDAGALRVGDELRTPNGTRATVTRIHDQRGPRRTHDLTVGGLHTYYVLAGATPVLVHNCGDAQALADRASEIHGQAGSKIAMSKSTVAVVSAQTPKGVVHVVAGSGRGLNKAQKGMLSGVEVPARNIPGTHAEQNALLFINEMGWSPIAGGASRSVCSEVCAQLIRAGGGRITGLVYQNDSGTKIRTFEW